jgi:hypothetical protein
MNALISWLLEPPTARWFFASRQTSKNPSGLLVQIQTVGGMNREFGSVLLNVKTRRKADTVDPFRRSDSSEAGLLMHLPRSMALHQK